MESGSELLRFYRHAGTDHRGRSLRQIRAFDVDRLEDTHDFIQWLFPLTEPSGANPHAPILSAADRAAFGADASLRGELVESLEVMLRFYGLELAGVPDAPRVERAGDFAARSADWLERSHNFLRISRMLRSLCLLGCPVHASAFLRCLEGIHAEQGHAIGANTLRYWRNAAGSR